LRNKITIEKEKELKMGFILIKGTYHIKEYSPDGDSIRFKADTTTQWNKLQGRKVILNSKDHAQLRIEAIDTLETHYVGQHQPLDLANKAMEKLLEQIGITNIKWNDKHTEVVEANDGVAGYILARKADQFGRPIAFVFPSTC